MGFFVLLVGIAGIILIPLACLIGAKDKNKRLNFSFPIIKWFMAVLTKMSGSEITYKGLENLPEKGTKTVYIGNHRGMFDILMFYPKVKTPGGFIAKAEMRTWPVVGQWMRLINCLFIDRQDPKQSLKTIIEGIKLVNSGSAMVIFPEGTRSKVEGEMLDFKPGSFKLATKPKALLVPVAFTNTSAVFEDQAPLVKKAKVAIEILEPIDTSTLSNKELLELHKKVHDMILERVRANGRELGLHE